VFLTIGPGPRLPGSSRPSQHLVDSGAAATKRVPRVFEEEQRNHRPIYVQCGEEEGGGGTDRSLGAWRQLLKTMELNREMPM